jgi:hypothetical protein
MGAGGGKWQRLMLLRNGKHPKDLTWLGTPIPEAKWSGATVSEVNIALTEVRRRAAIVDQKAGNTKPVNTMPSRFELVRQRIQAKEGASKVKGKNYSVDANKSTVSSPHGYCTGGASSSVSRLEALRLRIKSKEMKTKGFVQDPG